MTQISKQGHYPSDVLLHKASVRINKESVKLLYISLELFISTYFNCIKTVPVSVGSSYSPK